MLVEVVLAVVLVFLVAVWLGVVFVGPPYVPTLRRDLEKLFEELKLSPADHVVDLGAGDGRVLAMAAKSGAKTSGVELNPFLVLIARLRTRRFGTNITLGDMWRFKLSPDVTHVFIFPAEMYMNKLERYISSQKPGAKPRVLICYGFAFAGKNPLKVVGAFNLYQF